MSTSNRSRKKHLDVFLSDDEFDKLSMLSERSKLSKSELIRNMINGCQINEVPPLDFWELVKQIRFYGNNLNQISKRMHLFGSPDAEAYQRNTEKVFSILTELQKAMLSKDK